MDLFIYIHSTYLTLGSKYMWAHELTPPISHDATSKTWCDVIGGYRLIALRTV